jgi:enoyl-CoA hydratase
MMTYDHILIEREGGVGIVTLNRPDVLNAMNRKLGAELLDAVKTLEADDAIGCLVITGAGDKAFSAGGERDPGGLRQISQGRTGPHT